MSHTHLSKPEMESSEYTELKRDDLVLAIETARAEGFHSSEDALLELLAVLDEVLGVEGRIKYRLRSLVSIQ